MFAQMGNDKEFQERDWLARIYAMTDTEREGFHEGDPIRFTAPGPAAMSTPRPLTDAEKLWDSNEINFQHYQEEWGESNKATAEIETTDPRAVDRTEIIPKTTITTEIKGSSFPNQQKNDAFPRGRNQRNPMPGKTSVTIDGTRISQVSVNNANLVSGGVELINKWNAAVTFRIRIEIITNYLAERDRLESKIAAERVIVVPPKPATIEKIIADFRRYGRTTANPFEKEEVMKIMPKLEQIRERSYAMWKTKK